MPKAAKPSLALESLLAIRPFAMPVRKPVKLIFRKVKKQKRSGRK